MTVVRRFRLINPGKWPPGRHTKPRVLLEHPDRTVLWDSARALREAGYEVRICPGPGEDERCPLVEFGSCALVEDADVVVTSTKLGGTKELLHAYAECPGPRLVVEAPSGEFEEIAEKLPGTVFVPRPLDQHSLRAAVARAETRIR